MTSTTPTIDLPQWLGAIVALDAGAEMLQFDSRWFTWGWLGDGISRFDEVLTSAGFGDGTLVGVLMRNRPAVVRTIAATLATRRCLVTLSSAIPAAAQAATPGAPGIPVRGRRDVDDRARGPGLARVGQQGAALEDAGQVANVGDVVDALLADIVDDGLGRAGRSGRHGRLRPTQRHRAR